MGNCFSESKMDEATPAEEEEAEEAKAASEVPTTKSGGLFSNVNKELIDKDLAAPSMLNKGPFEKFELSLPFNRMLIRVYVYKIL
jgi:hypothetical protein